MVEKRLVQSSPLRVKTRFFAGVDMHLDAVAVVFDFVNPLLALGSLALQGRELGLNEPRHLQRPEASTSCPCSGYALSQRNSQKARRAGGRRGSFTRYFSQESGTSPVFPDPECAALRANRRIESRCERVLVRHETTRQPRSNEPQRLEGGRLRIHGNANGIRWTLDCLMSRSGIAGVLSSAGDPAIAGRPLYAQSASPGGQFAPSAVPRRRERIRIWLGQRIHRYRIVLQQDGGDHVRCLPVLAYMAQQAVEYYHWLQPGEMLVGLGMAETTARTADQRRAIHGIYGSIPPPGLLDPMLAGALGGTLAKWTTFVPCFLWIFLGGPYIVAWQQSPDRIALGITAAVIGVICCAANMLLFYTGMLS